MMSTIGMRNHQLSTIQQHRKLRGNRTNDREAFRQGKREEVYQSTHENPQTKNRKHAKSIY